MPDRSLVIKEDDYNYLKFMAIKSICAQNAAIKELKKVLHAFKEASIDIVVFKGIVLADLYTNYAYRSSCDADLLIKVENYEDAKNLLESMGYKLDKSNIKSATKAFVSNLLIIDLHTRIWGDMVGQFINVADKMDIVSNEKCIEIDVCGIQVKTLGYEEHFIFLLIHMAKHFILKGAGIKHMLDISLFYNKYYSYFNLNGMWVKIKQLGFYTFYQYIFHICIKYLGMDSSVLYDNSIIFKDSYVDFMLYDILGGGVFGGDPERSVAQTAAKESYYAGIESKSHFGLIMHMIFPHRLGLPTKYAYAKKYPILMPIAWAHRLISFFVNRLFGDGRVNLLNSVSVAERRVKLLSMMNLVDK